MAIRTLSEMTTDCRLHAQDDNTAGNGLLDAQWATLINEKMQAFASAFHEHFVIQADSKSTAFTSGLGTWTPTNSDYNVRRFLVLRIGSSNLERMEQHRIARLQQADPSAGVPNRYAIVHNNESATMTTAPNSFFIYLYPVPADGSYTLIADYEFYPKDLSGATDLPRGFGDAESRWLVRLAAARGAELNGKSPEFVAGILRDIPEEIQTRLNVTRGLLLPRLRPQEAPL